MEPKIVVVIYDDGSVYTYECTSHQSAVRLYTELYGITEEVRLLGPNGESYKMGFKIVPQLIPLECETIDFCEVEYQRNTRYRNFVNNVKKKVKA